jgi:hypothetical protein
MIVLLADASMHARSQQPGQLLDTQAWVDRVLPEISRSTAQGREIAQAVSGTSAAGARDAAGELATLAAQASATSAAVRSYGEPSQVVEAAGFLQASLAARQAGTEEMASAAADLLKGGPATTGLQAMTSAVSDFQLADNAYKLFLKALPPLGVTMPTSQWATGKSSYDLAELSAFARGLEAASLRTTGRQLAIDAITTDPIALSMQGKVELLSPSPTVSVTVIVADTGQVPENGVTVTAALSAQGSLAQSKTASINLSAGQAYAVTLTGFRLTPDIPTTLSVSASL